MLALLEQALWDNAEDERKEHAKALEEATKCVLLASHTQPTDACHNLGPEAFICLGLRLPLSLSHPSPRLSQHDHSLLTVS